MPLPFSHIVYADKILQDKLKGHRIDEREYFIAAVFPDIRHLVKEKRETTHPKFKSSKEIWSKIKKEKNSFILGWLVHLYVDVKWAEYWLEYFEKDVEKYSQNVIALDALSDQYLFDGFRYKDKIIKYLSEVCLKETKNYKLEDVKKWHKFVKKFLAKKLDYDLGKEVVKMIGRDKKVVDIIYAKVKKFRKNKDIIKKIKNFKNIL